VETLSSVGSHERRTVPVGSIRMLSQRRATSAISARILMQPLVNPKRQSIWLLGSSTSISLGKRVLSLSTGPLVPPLRLPRTSR